MYRYKHAIQASLANIYQYEKTLCHAEKPVRYYHYIQQRIPQAGKLYRHYQLKVPTLTSLAGNSMNIKFAL